MGFFDDRNRDDLGPPPEPFRVGGDGTPEVRSPRAVSTARWATRVPEP